MFQNFNRKFSIDRHVEKITICKFTKTIIFASKYIPFEMNHVAVFLNDAEHGYVRNVNICGVNPFFESNCKSSKLG